MGFNAKSAWLTAAITLALAAISTSATISVSLLRRKWRDMELKVEELQASLKSSSKKCASERQGRIRAQQALRKALVQPESSEYTSYPMTPIGVIQSCFSNRNGTPRQPLLVPLARACLLFDPARVPTASLDGLGEYSHCWIIYVFHLNTDLEKLWKDPSQSKFKAKVRVPRLKGGKMGVFATRSPHRPSPIGLTVAKVEAVQGHMVLFSGVDLVDGTPVLDVKPYIPYCDSLQGAAVPQWVKVDKLLSVASIRFSESFYHTLFDCWATAEKTSLYSSASEFQDLIKQVLSWDIRSTSQRNRPHDSLLKMENGELGDRNSDLDQFKLPGHEAKRGSHVSGDIIYHLILESLDVSYRIDCGGHVIVEEVVLACETTKSNPKFRSRVTWKNRPL